MEHKICTDYPNMIKRIIDYSDSFVKESKIECMIIGISGGIDSLVTAMLMQKVCRNNSIPLIGMLLPASTNKQDEISRSIQVAGAFCTKYILNLKVDEIARVIEHSLRRTYQIVVGKVRKGNIMARTRMIILYDHANLYNGIVLSTDNYTEYLLGFWTLHGDVGDFGPIQSLWKTEVYGIAEYLMLNSEFDDYKKVVIDRCIKALPTDGLGISGSDMDQIGGKDYFEVDKELIEFLNGNAKPSFSKVIGRHKFSEFKRRNPINIGRGVILGNSIYLLGNSL